MVNEKEKILNTRIINKHATLADWRNTSAGTDKGANFKLKEGEIALARIELANSTPTSGENNNISTTPAYIIKVGAKDANGTEQNFDNSAWAYAKAVDVYAWAKQANLPVECGDNTEAEGYVAGNVISAISFEDGKIKYTTATVATSEGFEDLTERVTAIEGYLELSKDKDGNPIVGLVNRVADLEDVIFGEDITKESTDELFEALSNRGYGSNVIEAISYIIGSDYIAEDGATLAGLMNKLETLIGNGDEDNQEVHIESWTNIGKLAYRLAALENNFDGDGNVEVRGYNASNIIDILETIVGGGSDEEWNGDDSSMSLLGLSQAIKELSGYTEDEDEKESIKTLAEKLVALDTIINGKEAEGEVPAIPSLEEKLTISCEGHEIVSDENDQPLFKRHVIKQGGETVCTIDIPKDLVVQSGTVEELAAGAAGEGTSAGTYIVLTLANATNDKIYIPADSLIEYVTSGSADGDMVVVSIDNDHKVTATLTDGKITKAKLDTTVQASLDKADGANAYTDAEIKKLDVTDITGMGAGKTIATLTETDGKIAATFQDIKITTSQISDFEAEKNVINGLAQPIPNEGYPYNSGVQINKYLEIDNDRNLDVTGFAKQGIVAGNYIENIITAPTDTVLTPLHAPVLWDGVVGGDITWPLDNVIETFVVVPGRTYDLHIGELPRTWDGSNCYKAVATESEGSYCEVIFEIDDSKRVHITQVTDISTGLIEPYMPVSMEVTGFAEPTHIYITSELVGLGIEKGAERNVIVGLTPPPSRSDNSGINSYLEINGDRTLDVTGYVRAGVTAGNHLEEVITGELGTVVNVNANFPHADAPIIWDCVVSPNYWSVNTRFETLPIIPGVEYDLHVGSISQGDYYTSTCCIATAYPDFTDGDVTNDTESSYISLEFNIDDNRKVVVLHGTNGTPYESGTPISIEATGFTEYTPIYIVRRLRGLGIEKGAQVNKIDSVAEEFNITAKQLNLNNNAISATHLKAEQGYTGEDAEVWVFDCGGAE